MDSDALSSKALGWDQRYWARSEALAKQALARRPLVRRILAREALARAKGADMHLRRHLSMSKSRSMAARRP